MCKSALKVYIYMRRILNQEENELHSTKLLQYSFLTIAEKYSA